MAKSAKKSSKKPAKKPVKKVSKKPVKKAPKKATRKPVKSTGKKFLVIYHVPADAMVQSVNATPEQQAEGMALWTAWAKRCGSKLIDMGSPLMNGKSLNPKGDFASSTKEVAGYSLMEAEDWNEIFSLLEDNPHISGWHPEATIEIHETMILPGM